MQANRNVYILSYRTYFETVFVPRYSN